MSMELLFACSFLIDIIRLTASVDQIQPKLNASQQARETASNMQSEQTNSEEKDNASIPLYDASLEFTVRVFEMLGKGEWMCAILGIYLFVIYILCMQCFYLSSVDGDKMQLKAVSAQAQHNNNEIPITTVDFSEGFNNLLRLFGHDSKFHGNLIIMTVAEQIWGDCKDDNLRFVFDLCMDNPDRIKMCVMDWGSKFAGVYDSSGVCLRFYITMLYRCVESCISPLYYVCSHVEQRKR